MKAAPALVAGMIDNLRRVFQVVNEQSERADLERLVNPTNSKTRISSPQMPHRFSVGHLSLV